MNGASLDRFRKIVGMLGSDQPGERAAAALKATSMLREAGMTWGQVGLGKGQPVYVQNDGAQIGYWRMMYEGERDRSTQLTKDIQKLKREVDRLKSMWPNGEPPKRRSSKPKVVREAEQESLLDYDKMLREKIAEVLEAAKRGEFVLGRGMMAILRTYIFTQAWSEADRATIEKTLRWVYAKGGAT